MLDAICKELKLNYDGMWEDAGIHQFTIIDDNLICKGASFSVHSIDRTNLTNRIKQIEQQYIDARKEGVI